MAERAEEDNNELIVEIKRNRMAERTQKDSKALIAEMKTE